MRGTKRKNLFETFNLYLRIFSCFNLNPEIELGI